MTYEEFIYEWKNPDEHIKVYTSGSTGNPKQINLSKKFVSESALRTNAFFGIQKGSRLHSCVSPDFIGGKMMAVRALLADANFSWEIPSNEPLKHLKKTDILHLLAVVPSQMLYILDNIERLPIISAIIIGGSPIHPDLRKKIAGSSLNAYETYGMTETASHIALRKICNFTSPFKTLPGIKVGKNEDGCLSIQFDSGETIHTNDITELFSDTEFLIKGRSDQVIISGGKKINPFEIEEKISHLITVPYLITSFPDEKWGEKLILLIEGKELDYEKLSKNLKNILPSWQIPKEILCVKVLPRTPNGKILRIKDPSSLSS